MVEKSNNKFLHPPDPVVLLSCSVTVDTLVYISVLICFYSLLYNKKNKKPNKITHKIYLSNFCLLFSHSRNKNFEQFWIQGSRTLSPLFWKGFCGWRGWVFLNFTHLAVVSASKIILHHKNNIPFPFFTLQLLFLKRNSPQKCNIGTYHQTTEPKTMNSLHANKCIHYQTLPGKKKRPFFSQAHISQELPFFFFSFLYLLHFPIATLQYSKLNTTFSAKREMIESCWMIAAYSVTTLGISSKEIVLEREAQQIQTDKSLLSPT